MPLTFLEKNDIDNLYDILNIFINDGLDSDIRRDSLN